VSDRYRVIIIGSGPSGYTAGVYLSRARLEPLLFSGIEIGGQLMYTSEVENFPGFPKGVRGPDLMSGMREQAERFGTKIVDAKVSKIEILPKGFRVWKDENSYEADAIVIATGAQSRMLGLPGEMEWLGQGLSTCAVCDAAFFRDKDVVVAGGGDSAMEDTIALTKFAKSVTLVHRRGEFRASKIMQERVLKNEKVKVRLNTEITGLLTEGISLAGVKLKSEGKEEELKADGVFYAIGHVPATAFLPEQVLKNKEGYVVTHLGFDAQSLELAQNSLKNAPVIPYLTMTSVPGIFAAGDCVDFRYRQAVTAAAYGTMAALDVERWLDEQAE
jgi:thioredoxin reductase (NADPH)